MTERIMAKVVKIDAVSPIENADAIEKATIGGWNVVVKKGEYKEQDIAVYLEIDSWVPRDVAPFLFDGKSFEGVEGARLRTKKLRGVISQGLLLPISTLPSSVDVGTDVSEALGIKKWEAPINLQLVGVAKGNFPWFIPKTDQERVQNLVKEIAEMQGEKFEATIKLDGSSITVYSRKEENGGYTHGVCSRNLDLVESDSAFWVAAKQEKLHEKIVSTGRSLAIQGELLNTNIQGNWEKVDKLCMFVYDIFDIDAQKYLLPKERQELCKQLDIPHVPILDGEFVLNKDVFELLEYAEGEGMNKGVKREGVVFKHLTSDFSMKAISNSYLTKNKDA